MTLFHALSWSQISLENTWKVGQNNASSGAYLKTAFAGMYSFKNFNINSQLQFDVVNPQERTFSGLLLRGSKDSLFLKFPISFSAQYLFLPYSETLRESNISFIANGYKKGFSYALGVNFRTYAYTRQAVEDYDLEQQRLHENWTLIYNLGYTYSPHRYQWDVGLFLTNWDDFLINQDMNLFWRLKGQYYFNQKINLYAEANYLKSGTFNSSSNYFGYYIKTGIIWHVN